MGELQYKLMKLSEKTNQTGLVQRVEFWTRRPYGTSGDDLRTIITNLNEAFADILPMLLMGNDKIRWDDVNNTDKPVGKINIVASQNDYKITTDDNSLDILNLVGVHILTDASTSTYTPIAKANADDPDALNFVSPPDTSVTGTPSRYLEVGNILYLDILPSYSATNGIKLFFQRQQTYFTVTGTSGDDTTEPGIPLPFHELLALIAAQKLNMVNRTDDTNLLTILSNEIARKKKELRAFVNMRHPAQPQLTTKIDGFI